MFLEAVFVNGAASGFAADLLVSSGIFWAYLASVKEPRWMMYVLLNLTVGLSCALPLYMYLNAANHDAALLDIDGSSIQ